MELEEESARLEGVIRFTVKKFSRLKEAVLSEPVYIQSLPWRLMCIQRSASLRGHENVKTLAVFLQCSPETESSSWSCNATSQLVLVNQKHPEKSFKKKIQHLFFPKENDWGFSNFKEWNEILNTENGFLVDDTIIVEAHVVADAPRGVVGLKAKRTKERSEACLYMSVQVITEDQFCGHQGFDLFDPKKQSSRIFKMRKEDTVAKMMKQLADALGYKPNQIRPWPFNTRKNNTYRVGSIDMKNVLNNKLLDVMDNENECCLFIETTDPSKPDAKLPSFDIETDILLFFKYYDPRSETMYYCGHAYVPLNEKISSLLPMLCERAHLPKDTPLMLFEEVRPGLIEHFKDLNLTIEDQQEVMDGDIYCFQRKDIDLDEFKLRTCMDYFRDYQNQMEVTLYDKNVPNDPGFNVILSSTTSYTQMAEKVAWYLDVDPGKIQFFRAQVYGGGLPDNPIQCTYEGTLRDLMIYSQKSPKKLFYQLVSPPGE